jgi:hypothetical protein
MRSPFLAYLRRATAGLIVLASLSCGEERATEPSSESPALAVGPALLQCPTNQASTTQAIVTSLGGVVRLGNTSISIPSGSVVLPTLITVTIPASKYVEVEVRANQLVHFVFQQPVSITIDYSRCNRSNIDQTPAQAWYIDAVTKQMLENMNGVDNKATQSITFTTGHLSNYAVAF